MRRRCFGHARGRRMTVVVTGSNGFIGHHTCRGLAALGEDVIGVDDLSSGRAEDAPPGAACHVHCVTDMDWLTSLLRKVRPQAVIHLAAAPRVGYSVSHPLESAKPNLMGTIAVLNALLAAQLADRTRLVFASSSSVYGAAEALPTPESHPCDPQSPYALAKLQGEAWCALFHRLYGLDVVSLRYFNVFGPGGRFGGAYSTVVPAWLHHLYVEPAYQPYLEGDGAQSRDFCYIDNVVQANIAAATRPQGFAGETLNIGQGRAYSLQELRDALERIAGRSLPLQRRQARAGDVRHTLADISQAQAELRYQPAVDLDQGLAQTAAWFAECQPAPATNA